MKILITGASGHLGTHLIALLTKDNTHEIIAVALDATTAASLKNFSTIKKYDIDICDDRLLDPLCMGCDIVYHLAAMVPPIIPTPNMEEKMFRVHVDGTRTVTSLALKYCVKRFIHLSTIHAYAELFDDAPLDESGEWISTEKNKYISPYDRTKAQAELVVRDAIKSGLNALIIQPTGIIGPNDYKKSPTNYVIHQAAVGKVSTVPDAGFNWVDVRDVASTLKNALILGRIGESYILAGSFHDLVELVSLAYQTKQLTKKPKTIPLWVLSIIIPVAWFFARLFSIPTALRPQTLYSLKNPHKNINDKKARSELNHTNRSIDESVRDTILSNAPNELGAVT